jgi:hypothetical protein
MNKYQEALKIIMDETCHISEVGQPIKVIKELVDKETQGYYLKIVDDLEQIKSLETNQLLLAIDITGKKTIINKWYINSKQELIYSDDKDRINLKMYFGIIEANSYIRDLYIL